MQPEDIFEYFPVVIHVLCIKDGIILRHFSGRFEDVLGQP